MICCFQNENLGEVWFWGPASSDFVETILLREEEGAFVVFIQNGKQDELTLAIRVVDGVIFKTIYHRDDLYGFTEPLGFEDLNSVLDAYNSSEVDPVKLISTLRRPEGTADFVPEEVDVLKEFKTITDLLLFLRKTGKLLGVKVDEQEKLKLEMKRITQEIEALMTKIAGLKKMTGIMEHQKQLLSGTRLRSSTNQSRSEDFTRNDNIIEVHLQEIDKRVKDVERETESKRTEYNRVSNEHSHCITEISRLESEQESCKSRLEGQPQFLEFVEGLLLNDFDTDSLQLDKITWYKDCSKGEADKLLLDPDNLDGTFLVRAHKPNDGLPYCVCVVWTTKKSNKNVETQERKVEKFVVTTSNGYFGFDPSTCIFESLEELIIAYSRIPFKVHDMKYGDLTLNYPVFMGLYQNNRNS